MVLNMGAATRVFWGGESHLDLAFSSLGVANMASWEVLDYSCGSDHSLIQIELQLIFSMRRFIIQGRCLKELIGKEFSEEFDAKLKMIVLNGDVDYINVEVAEAIFKVAETSIPKV